MHVFQAYLRFVTRFMVLPNSNIYNYGVYHPLTSMGTGENILLV